MLNNLNESPYTWSPGTLRPFLSPPSGIALNLVLFNFVCFSPSQSKHLVLIYLIFGNLNLFESIGRPGMAHIKLYKPNITLPCIYFSTALYDRCPRCLNQHVTSFPLPPSTSFRPWLRQTPAGPSTSHPTEMSDGRWRRSGSWRCTPCAKRTFLPSQEPPHWAPSSIPHLSLPATGSSPPASPSSTFNGSCAPSSYPPLMGASNCHALHLPSLPYHPTPSSIPPLIPGPPAIPLTPTPPHPPQTNKLNTIFNTTFHCLCITAAIAIPFHRCSLTIKLHSLSHSGGIMNI